ncbi:MAG: hypothetical protein ACK2U0_07430, partial [Candidatus Promineifilaceae bacterium]
KKDTLRSFIVSPWINQASGVVLIAAKPRPRGQIFLHYSMKKALFFAILCDFVRLKNADEAPAPVHRLSQVNSQSSSA